MSISKHWRAAALPATVAGSLFVLALVLAAHRYGWYASAATYAGNAQAEFGTVQGNAHQTANASASNGAAVMFGGSSGSCTAPAGLVPVDLDAAHGGTDQIPAWRHTLGAKAVIYFATSGLPAEYAGYIRDGAAVWNASPCIDAEVVTTCPASSNCVQGLVSQDSSTDYDGVFSGNGNGAYTYLTDGTITFVKRLLDQESATYKRMVVAHEMGHAVSLGHRLTVADLMYWSSDEYVALAADHTALNNILAIYGVRSDATTTPITGQDLEAPTAGRTSKTYYHTN